MHEMSQTHQVEKEKRRKEEEKRREEKRKGEERGERRIGERKEEYRIIVISHDDESSKEKLTLSFRFAECD
jgi:hypothetical protein